MTRQLPFRAFTIKHNGTVRRIVMNIKLSVAFDPNNPPPANQRTLMPFNALWDTGATGSVITPKTATSLGLVSVGTGTSHTAGGIQTVNRYLVNLYLPNDVAFAGLLVSDCVDTGGFEAIIGMDVIAAGDSTISNHKGQTWLSYRIPPAGGTDYVVEAHKTLFAGVGRNQPCPCGATDPSGKPKKFKFCHGQ
jgi:hypothetical protein